MKRQDALYVAMCVGTIAFAIAFVYPQLTEQAVAWYFPLEREWSYQTNPTTLAIDFYGRLAHALIAWAAAVIVSLLVTRRVRVLSERMAGLLIAWALTFTLLVILYYAWTLAFRTPVPSPIPDWYHPR